MTDYAQQIIDLYHSTVETSIRQMPFDASSLDAFQKWQRKARRQVSHILGPMPREKVDFQLERKVVDETDSFIQERLVYFTRPGLQATAYLLTPRKLSASAPGVLALHGHGTEGKDGAVDPDSIYGGFACTLAEAGCVVLAPDQIGSGERRLKEDRVNYQVLIHGLNMLGHTLIGVRYWDLVRALDLLQDQEGVDRDRIGVMGLSLGGEMTMFLSALQSRLKAAVVCGYLTSHLNTFLGDNHCTCGYLPNLAKYFEHVDLAALFAPRPMFLDSGKSDPSFPWKDAQALVRELRSVYRLYDKPRSHLGIEIHDGGHIIAGKKSIPWLVRRLKEDLS
ncbi:MAG: alpha/beta hydrolase family protein [Planctomycetota bacterium]|jgi:dienelactone hydrolase|nr:alpha/beta hydrolase family protein [Planctomycetota bacterium]MDP7251941.1 alpha/beta hydrolase family protein [Planctomycetota bacterium]